MAYSRKNLECLKKDELIEKLMRRRPRGTKGITPKQAQQIALGAALAGYVSTQIDAADWAKQLPQQLRDNPALLLVALGWWLSRRKGKADQKLMGVGIMAGAAGVAARDFGYKQIGTAAGQKIGADIVANLPKAANEGLGRLSLRDAAGVLGMSGLVRGDLPSPATAYGRQARQPLGSLVTGELAPTAAPSASSITRYLRARR